MTCTSCLLSSLRGAQRRGNPWVMDRHGLQPRDDEAKEFIGLSPALFESNRFARRVLDLTPGFFNIAYDRFGHGHIVQIKRDFVAVLVRPGEELERFGRVGGLVL